MRSKDVCVVVAAASLVGCGLVSGYDFNGYREGEVADAADGGSPADGQPTTDAPADMTVSDAPREASSPFDSTEPLDAVVQDTANPLDSSPPPVDAPADVAMEASEGGADGGVDAAEEGASDGASDAPAEAAADATRDAPVDGPSDAPRETAADAACPPVTRSGSTAVAFQITTAHDGSQPADVLTLPLCRKWTYSAGGLVSYPLVASELVVVTYTTSAGAYVVALHESSGALAWGPVPLGSAGRVNAAYDNGTLFTVTVTGVVQALEVTTGTTIWTMTLTGQSMFTSAPTAAQGMVYTAGSGSGGTLYGMTEAGGSVAWMQSVENGDQSSPAVGGGAVFVSYVCNQAYSFSLAGQLNWHHVGGCEGGGGANVALLGSNVYVRDSSGDLVLASATGTPSGAFVSTPIPAGSSTTGYFESSGTLTAIAYGAPTPAWSFMGDTELVTAPIVVGSNVVVGSSSGNLYVVDASTGAMVSSDVLPSGLAGPDEGTGTQPLSGLAAADGMLFVPDGNVLYAY